jgi:hypothetical protein
MDMNKLLLVLIVLCTFVFNVGAQEDVSQYFDDGGISENNRLIKFGIDLFNGEYSVLYEQELFRNMSIEAFMGLSSISRQSSLYNWNSRYGLPQSGTGVFFAANIRLYLKEYYERWYIGFQPKFNIMGGKLMTDIVFFNGGCQLPLQKNLTLDFNVGMGVRTYKYSEEVTSVITYEDRDSHFYIPATIKLGYAF